MTRLRHAARGEEGWALVTVMALMAIMLAFGLATMSTVDTQQRQSGVVRTKETAFNAAEAVLNAQIFALSRDWPGRGAAPAPYTPCTAASSGARCPTADALLGLITSADAANGIDWQTSVRDNGTAQTESYYSDDLTGGAPGYDANGDGKLWVRAQASAQGRTRTLVALVRVEEVDETMPHAAIIAGRLQISNQGNKVIVDGTAGTGSLGTAVVRCVPRQGESQSCLGHQVSGNGLIGSLNDLTAKLNQQLSPAVTLTGYQGGPALGGESHARLKATAKADGTYYAGCPSTMPSGRVVWIESGNCTWTSNTVANSQANPGLLVMNSGTLYFGGTTVFHGIVYAINAGGATGNVVQVQGNAQVVGGVLVDGPGGLVAGSSKVNVVLDENAFTQVRSYASAGIIQNTWREIRSTR